MKSKEYSFLLGEDLRMSLTVEGLGHDDIVFDFCNFGVPFLVADRANKNNGHEVHLFFP